MKSLRDAALAEYQKAQQQRDKEEHDAFIRQSLAAYNRFRQMFPGFDGQVDGLTVTCGDIALAYDEENDAWQIPFRCPACGQEALYGKVRNVASLGSYLADIPFHYGCPAKKKNGDLWDEVAAALRRCASEM